MGFQRRRRFNSGRPVIAEKLDEELAHHLDLLTEELVDEGWERSAARREAQRRFGDPALYEEACRSIDRRHDRRERRRLELHGLGHDLRYAWRRFRQHPLITTVVVATLALGIGSSSAIFTLVHGVLLSPLPYPGGDRLALVWQKERRHPQLTAVSPPNFYDYRDEASSFEALAAYSPTGVSLTGGGEPERVLNAFVTADFFAVLGVEPALGRAIAAADFDPSPAPVAVVSHGFWQRRLGGRGDAVGVTIEITGQPYEVIGVMPPGFGFPERRTSTWLPDHLPRARGPVAGAPYRAFRVVQVVGRLADGVTIEAARAELGALSEQLETAYPESNRDQEAVVQALEDHVAGAARPALLVLSGAVGLVLLLAAANVAHLLLVQAASRESEMAIRGALGAGAGRLARQLLAEYLVLAVAGGALGVLVAAALVEAILGLAGDALPRAHEVSIDATVLLVTVGLSLVTGLGVGLLPLVHARRSDLNTALRSGTREIGGARVRRTHAGLVVAELALAVPLLVGGGLLAKSFHRLQSVDPGFVADNVWTFRVALPRQRYDDPSEWTAFYDALRERLASIPGVVRMGTALQVPILGHDVDRTPITLESDPEDRTSRMSRHHVVSPGYFETLRIARVAGRTFDGRDRSDSPAVAVINETMARRLWPGEDPIGRRFTHEMQLTPEEPTTREVIGVVADVRQFDLATPAEEQFYLPAGQTPWPSQSFVVRTPLGASELAAAVRHELRQLDGEIPISELVGLPEAVATSIGRPRLERWLLVAFAVTALFLATIGLYGVMAYSVSQRTHELGLRMALGAGRGDVVALIVRSGLRLTTLGVLVGLAGAWGLSRLLQGQLFEVRAGDASIYAATLALVAAVALVATLVPALRTMRIHPSRALRSL